MSISATNSQDKNRKTPRNRNGAWRKARERLTPPSISYFANEMRELKALLANSGDNGVRDELKRINDRISGLESKLDLYAGQIYRNRDETNFEARKRLFKSLPEATGAKRTFQLVNAKLLNTLSEFCRKTRTEYWMWAGSAIAISGRSSAIPWDDDIDICMMREDFLTLKDYVNRQTDYYITTVYDYVAHNIQYRFVSRDEHLHNFIDIVLCDWGRLDTAEDESKYLAIVEESQQEMDENPDLQYWREHKYLENPKEPKTYQVEKTSLQPIASEETKNRKIIDKIFKKALNRARKSGIICGKSEANAVVYSVENLFNFRNRPNIWPKDLIFPIKQLPYEGFLASAANQDEAFCDLIYPGWPFLANIADVNLHQDKNTYSVEYQAVMQKFLEDK